MAPDSTPPALPAGPSGTVQAAFDYLGLDPETATLDDVEEAFSEKAPAVHPDTSEMDGDATAFAELLHARQIARTYLQ